MSLKPSKPSKAKRNDQKSQQLKEQHQSMRAALLVSPQKPRPWKTLLKERNRQAAQHR